jgi:Glycosyl transferase family 11
MDVILIFNGLGNQMSQYAFYLSKKKISNSTRFLFSKKSNSVHNGYELDDVFGINYRHTLLNEVLFLIYRIASYRKYKYLSKPVIQILKLMRIVIVNENDDYSFKPEYMLPSKGIRFYVGGWHTEKYFATIKEEVRGIFKFKTNEIGSENRNVLNRIESSNSVSVHIRRGDFMNPDNYNKFGSVCTLNYFTFAIEKMKLIVPNPHFFFFTNDVVWVKENFSGADMTIICTNTAKNSWKDMFLISKCSGHICSNGSFSWWSAWLDEKKDRPTIVPKNFVAKKYFSDLYPEKWIQLSEY